MLIGSNTLTDFVRLVMVKSKVAVIAMILVVVIVLVTDIDAFFVISIGDL